MNAAARATSLCFVFALGACDQLVAARAETEKDRPRADSEGPVTTQADQSVINATPQESLSIEDRETFRELAKGYLDDSAAELAKGFAPTTGFRDEVVALQPTQTHAWRIALKRGQIYRVIGACDNECSDLDLELVDPAGKLIERDTLPDDMPVVNVNPRADGEYTLRLVMKACSIAPCYSAARVYSRSPAVARSKSA